MVHKAPDLAFFCENGHLVSATNEAEMVEIKQIPPCFCGSKHLRALANWPVENQNVVPLQPIGSIKVGFEQIEVDVFDVLRLFAPWFEPAWDINWDKIPDDLKGAF
jgi:hypothetical protein